MRKKNTGHLLNWRLKQNKVTNYWTLINAARLPKLRGEKGSMGYNGWGWEIKIDKVYFGLCGKAPRTHHCT